MSDERPKTKDRRPKTEDSERQSSALVFRPWSLVRGPWSVALRPAAWVGLLLLSVYLLSTGGQPFISDGEVMLITAMRIVDEHTVSLPEGASIYPQTVRRADGYLFSKYGPGQPVAAAPLYALGRYALRKVLPLTDDRDFLVGRFFTLLLPALATALTGALLCRWAALLYGSARMGVALALLFGLGTLAWPYSRFFFSEPLFTACLVLAALAIRTRHPLLAGLALGYAVFTRVGGAALLPAFGLYAWLVFGMGGGSETTFKRSNVQTFKHFGWMALGGLPFALLLLAYNWVRFRALTEQGYANEGFTGNLLVGLYGLLLSPGKSVFLYVPLLLALPWAIVPFARRYRPEAALVGALAAITLLQSALWWIWWAGWGWGPRFLVPLMPFLILMLGVLLERRAWRRIIGLALLPLSIAVNLLGILVDFNSYIIAVTGGDMSREAIYLFQPAYSPILAHIRSFDLANAPIVSFALSSPQIGFPQPWATLLSASFVALLALAAIGLWRSVRGQPFIIRG
ncbi:MAG: hypothetical protein IPO81_01310 [Kouleothrix sp.]|nr:hypothetical protein [Kouleothrix sp.]